MREFRVGEKQECECLLSAHATAITSVLQQLLEWSNSNPKQSYTENTGCNNHAHAHALKYTKLQPIQACIY